MDIKEYSKRMKAKCKELDQLMRRKMPVIAGRMAKDHFQNNFRQEGFVNGGLHPWPKAKRLSSGGTDAASRYGTLFSRRNHLFKSLKYMPADYRVKVANDLIYAPLHNWGGEISPTVTPKMRRFAWAMFYKMAGINRKMKHGGKARKKRMENVPEEALQWKRLALTKKKKLRIPIPRRQFLGESKELTERITQRTDDEIRKILNS